MESPPAALADLVWLAGYWSRREGDHVEEEVWLEPWGGCMVGLHRDAADAHDGLSEGLRIAPEDGSLVLWVSRPDREMLRFELAEIGSRRVVFSRSGPGFPTRVSYHRDGETLHAAISDGEREMSWSWRFASPLAAARPPPPGKLPESADRA